MPRCGRVVALLVDALLRRCVAAPTVRDGVAACLIVCGVLAVARSETSATTASAASVVNETRTDAIDASTDHVIEVT